MTPGAAAQLEAYLDACQSLQTSRIVACFAADARLRDPLNPQGICGAAAIADYFDAIYRELASLEFALSPIYWASPRDAALRWVGTARRHDGTVLHYQGVDVFTFADDHRIADLWAFWQPSELNPG